MDVFSWPKAITVSVCLHIFLLVAAGYLVTDFKVPATMQGKILLDMEFTSDSVGKAENASGLPGQAAASVTPETGKIHSASGSQLPEVRRNVNSVTPSEAKRPDSSEPVAKNTVVTPEKIVEAAPNPVTSSEAKRPHSSESVVANISTTPNEISEAVTNPVTPSEAKMPHSNESVLKNTAAVPGKIAEAATGTHTAVTGRRVNGSNAASGANGNSGRGTGGAKLTGGNFAHNGDGTYTALSPAGIDYTIVHSVEAHYPEEARAIGYARLIRVKAVILVGLNGKVESVSILNNVPDLGFCEAVRQALMQWKFKPIYYQGINIKMKFNKNIYFEPS